jgi:hypothetical protein
VNGKIKRCFFSDNYAETYGGAIYNINQHLKILDCTFTANVVGSPSSLFADNAAAGGAIWYSATDSTNLISGSNFYGTLRTHTCNAFVTFDVLLQKILLSVVGVVLSSAPTARELCSAIITSLEIECSLVTRFKLKAVP